MRALLVAVIDLYRLAARPFLPPACRFHPSCGDYAREAFSRHGVLRASALSAARLARCHPLHPGGFDPVPANPS